MPKSIGRTDLALGAVGAALVVLVVVLGAIAYSKQENQQRDQREQTAQYQADDSEQQWEALCTPVSRNRPLTCVLNPPEAKADAERAERDLRAQEQMANWALLMFFATAVGVITTIIGLIYVVRAYFVNADATKHASRAANAATDANAQTRAQFVAQQRPWLSVDVAMANARRINQLVTGPVIFRITNYGPSPATHVEVRFHGAPVLTFSAEEREVFSHMTVVQRQRFTEGGEVVFPSPQKQLTLERDVSVSADIDRPVHLLGWIAYRFEGAGRTHLTPFRAVLNICAHTGHARGEWRASAVMDTVGIAPD